MRFTSSNMRRGERLSRRDFLRLLKVGAIDLALLAAGGGIYSLFVEPGLMKVKSISLKLPRLTSGFSGIRIAHVSDIHMGGWMNAERLQNVADLVAAQKPDLLLLTGDFLLGHVFDEDSE